MGVIKRGAWVLESLKLRVLFFIVGLIIMTFGISMTIKADLGAGAWDALNVGLKGLVGLTVGNWVIIIGVFLMLLNAWILKKRPDYLAIITVLVIGVMIDFWLLLVMDTWLMEGFIKQYIFLFLGILILGFGVSIYLQPKFSLNPVDGFMVSLRERFNLSTRVAKTLTEGIAFVIALSVGGPIGIGTFIILFCAGPAIQLFEPTITKLATYLDQNWAA